MASPTRLPQTRVAAFDRIEQLADETALTSILGPLEKAERQLLPDVPSGYSNSRHEILRVVRRDGWWAARLTRWSAK